MNLDAEVTDRSAGLGSLQKLFHRLKKGTVVSVEVGIDESDLPRASQERRKCSPKVLGAPSDRCGRRCPGWKLDRRHPICGNHSGVLLFSVMHQDSAERKGSVFSQ